MVDIQNAAMSEFNTSYRTAEYLLIDTVGDYYRRAALKKLYVYRYALKNPDSYVALWQIEKTIENLRINSYPSNFLIDSSGKY